MWLLDFPVAQPHFCGRLSLHSFAPIGAQESGGAMAGFAWSEMMSVGVPVLDADHRCIVRIINPLRDSEGEDRHHVIETVLDTLVGYCRYHFAREEQVMAWCGFPGIDFHRRAHESFASFVTLLRERYADGHDTALADEMQDYLMRWLCHHILIQDMAYKSYVIAADSANVLADVADRSSRDHVDLFTAAIVQAAIVQ
jgi:hemerythrin-like metal-binding protein